MSKTVLERTNYILEIRKGVEKLDTWDKQLIAVSLSWEREAWLDKGM